MEFIQDMTSPAEPWHLTALILSKTLVAQGPLRAYTALFYDFLAVFFLCGLSLKKMLLFPL